MKTQPQTAAAGGRCFQHARKSAAVSNSTKGYRNENGRPQQRAWPRRMIQERIGMLSYQAIGLPHPQVDPGRTIDLPGGNAVDDHVQEAPDAGPEHEYEHREEPGVLSCHFGKGSEHGAHSDLNRPQ